VHHAGRNQRQKRFYNGERTGAAALEMAQKAMRRICEELDDHLHKIMIAVRQTAERYDVPISSLARTSPAS